MLLLDYHGYGGNPGDPTEAGLALDVRAARDFLEGETRTPLVYFGESLGSAVVTEPATEHPPSALILRPAELLEQPDQPRGHVDLTAADAVAGAGGVGVMGVCHDSPIEAMASGQKFADLSRAANGRSPIM